MIRKIYGMILAMCSGGNRVRAARQHKLADWVGGLRSREHRIGTKLWNDIGSDGFEVEIGGATWELWFGQDGLTVAPADLRTPSSRESRRGSATAT